MEKLMYSPKTDSYLCWEPTLEEGRSLLTELEEALDFLCDLPGETAHMRGFREELRKQVISAEEELEESMKRHKERTEKATMRLVNEEQLQDAVKFLASVWKGEQEATLSQVAAARCFMRTGEDY